MRLARLDGVRAVAVLLVIFLHHFMGERTGWAGVDIFFVLSGFLITGILLRSKDTDHYWRTFYIKRATRILPPLFILFTSALLLTHHLNKIGLMGYALFLGNVMNMTRYALAPFIVMWSLAIEEHFYLLWPFFTRYLRLRTLFWMLLGLIFIEPLARMGAMMLHLPPMSTYYLTPFRLDGLACGAMLALTEITGRGKEWIRHWGGWLSWGIWTVLIALELLIPSFTRESGTLLFNLLGYSLAAWASVMGIGYIAWNSNSIASRVLEFPMMAWIGRISYGMYLYHGMVLGATRHLFHVQAGAGGVVGTRLLILVDIPLTLLVSWVSFRFIETPVVSWGHRMTRREESVRAHQFD